uniref:CCD97-like C-terminal domain-containing protein n=1 Tax=Setaria digitata TaxID=48799 RepID=A0A915Q0G6_9BILA
MIDRIIACGDIFYRSEQRDTPDLIMQEKRALLENLYMKDPQLFIRRYHKYLVVEDCEYFDQDDYEIKFYTKEVIERCKDVDSKKRKDVKLRNQRYAELQRLKRETDYFSNKKMREREPLLFDKMIGRFLPEEEQIHLRPTVENESLSGVFMQFEDSQIISNRRTAHLKEWNDFLRFDREEKSKFGNLVQHASSRFCEELECDDNNETKCADGLGEAVDGDCKPTSSYSKEEEMILESSEEDCDQDQLRADFIDHMEQRFLRGDDTEFYDYSLVDKGMMKEYEQMCDRDLEEAYFEND